MRVSPLQYTQPHVTVMSLQGCKLPALPLRSVQPTSACGHHSDRAGGGIRDETGGGDRWAAADSDEPLSISINTQKTSQGESSEYQRGLRCSEASESTRAPHAALCSFSCGIIWKAYTVLSLLFCSETKGELRARLECELASLLGATLAPKHPLFPETWALNQ